MSAWNAGKKMYSHEKVFCKNADVSQHLLRKYYSHKKDILYKCIICEGKKWLGKELKLELDHKNGDNQDNRLENLRWLCPNCHSQTPTFKGNNNGIRKVEDDKFIEAIKESKNVREVLLKIGLRPRGGNYNRVYRLMIKNNLSFPLKEDNLCLDCQKKIDRTAIRCIECDALRQRKVKNRPSKEQLLKEIEETNYCAVGRKYGVSDNCIRKWIV